MGLIVPEEVKFVIPVLCREALFNKKKNMCLGNLGKYNCKRFTQDRTLNEITVLQC